MLYLIAALYTDIKSRNGATPYFNTRIFIVFILLLHIMQIIAGIHIAFREDLMPAKDVFILLSVVFGAIVFWLLTYVIPLSKLKEIGVKPAYAKKTGWACMAYLMLNLILLMVLIINRPPPDVLYMPVH